MAIRDYILCEECQCKLVYDGNDENRDWLQERFGVDDLICPKCLNALRAELAEVKSDRTILCAQVDRLLAADKQLRAETTNLTEINQRLVAELATLRPAATRLSASLVAEKTSAENLAIRLMGEDAYGNSPCQAHPLELLENWITEELAAAVLAEREKCARICESIQFMYADKQEATNDCAAVIRGQKP